MSPSRQAASGRGTSGRPASVPAHRGGPRPARPCSCARAVPYQDPGEWAACAKCGRLLDPDRAQRLGAVAVALELPDELPRAGSKAVAGPQPGGLEREGSPVPGRVGRPRAGGRRSRASLERQPVSAPERSDEDERLVLALWCGEESA